MKGHCTIYYSFNNESIPARPRFPNSTQSSAHKEGPHLLKEYIGIETFVEYPSYPAKSNVPNHYSELQIVLTLCSEIHWYM